MYVVYIVFSDLFKRNYQDQRTLEVPSCPFDICGNTKIYLCNRLLYYYFQVEKSETIYRQLCLKTA